MAASTALGAARAATTAVSGQGAGGGAEVLTHTEKNFTKGSV